MALIIKLVFSLSKNSIFHYRTEHININFHFIIDILEKCDVKLLKISTKINSAYAYKGNTIE